MWSWTFLRNIELRIPRRRDLVPILAAAALAGLAALETLLPVAPDLPAAPGLAPRRVPVVDSPPARNYPAVLGAALFAPDRPRVPGVFDIAGTLDGYRALGIAIAGRLVSAVVQSPDGAITRAQVGDKVGGWTLSEANLSRLVFVKGKEQRVLLVNSN